MHNIYFNSNFITVIALLTIVSFFLPPNATEKILIGVINLLILSLYLLYFSAILPPMGDHMPFIGMFNLKIKIPFTFLVP